MGNSYGNRGIVLNDLRFNADPANKQSYPGSGTKLYDTISIEGSSIQDAFGNITGATFNTDNAGFFRYDGNDFIAYNEGIELPEGTNQLTMDVWFNSTDAAVRSLFCYRNTDNNIMFQLRRTSTQSQLQYRWFNDQLFDATFSEVIDEEDTWFNITVVHEGTNINLYKNGSLFSAQSGFEASFNLEEPGKFFIGTQDGSNRFWNGDISCIKVYSKSFSASEVFQNYNALKHRFRF